MEEYTGMAQNTGTVKLDPVWDRHAERLSIGTYADYYRLHGVSTVLRAGKVACYYKEKGPSLQTAKKEIKSIN